MQSLLNRAFPSRVSPSDPTDELPPPKNPANRVIAVQFMFHFHASVFFYFTKAQYVTGP